MAFGLSAGAVAAIGSVGGALIGANASNKAAGQQADAANRASGLSNAQFQQTRQDQLPYRQAGYTALDRLNMLLGLNPAGNTTAQGLNTDWQTSENFDAGRYLRENPDVAAAGKDPLTHWIQAGQFEGRKFPGTAPAPVAATGAPASDPTADPMYGYLTRKYTGESLQSDPGYQFGLNQGTQATDRSASARGGLYSGATLKALQKYGQDYAGTKFNEGFNRDQVEKNSLFNQLSGISGTGQNATNQVNAAGANNANNMANGLYGAANAGAANSLAQGNILQNGINQGLSMWQRANKNTGTNYSGAADPFNYYTSGNGGSGD